ncbi:MAG: ribonuclease [Bacteriovoracaceae bacterium]|nr:ribonuclease [Bacteriovoracaceae bacterium]
MQQKQPQPKPSKLKKESKLLCSFRLELESGYSNIVGIDEVGRGCLAGPVVAAGVIFSKEIWSSDEEWVSLINDSKTLDLELREKLNETIWKRAIAVEIAFCSPAEVDEINILQATFKAAREVIEKIEAKLPSPIELILMDGSHKISQLSRRQHPIVKGDSVSRSIAAASIVAKVYRDQWMVRLGLEHPGYGFEKHRGYGTKEHLIALRKLGPSPIHRRSFLKKMASLAYGREAEERALSYLKENGFKIIEQNWKTAGAEIDLIVEKKKELHFIEVRYRSEEVDLPLIFPKSKQEQYKKAVELYFFKNSKHRKSKFHVHFFSVSPGILKPYWDVFKF